MTALNTHAQMLNETLRDQDVSQEKDPSAEFDAMFGSDINASAASHQSTSSKALRKNQRHYALAAFIAGCLIQEEVIEYDPNNSDTVSDLECGIRIIAACLKNYIDNEESFGLPFEW